MLGLALRNLSARKFRAFSTALAVFLGVSMITGTLLINDSVKRSFDGLFTEINASIDVTVREASVVEADFGEGESLRGFDASLLEQVAKVDGVETAEGVVADPTITILGDDGERIGPEGGGPPHIALSSVQNEDFNPLTIVEGERPAGPDDVTIDVDSAENEDFEVGDPVTIVGSAGAKEYSITGLTQFGSGNTSLGASLAEFTLPEAQRLTDKRGKFDELDLVAGDGVAPEELARRVQAEVGDRFDVRTGEETANDDATEISDGFGFLTTALLVFAGIAVLVGGFLIFNTFSITVAQRVREFAMLRTLGASSGQVLSAVLIEAVLIGLLAAALGIVGAFGIVEALKALFSSIGFDLPVTDLRITTGTILIAAIVGVVATVLSAMFPAIRATRVAPLEALRESGGSTEGAERTSRRRSVIAVLLMVGAAALFVLGLTSDQAIEPALTQMGLGLVLLFAAIAMLGSRFVPPLASGLGLPFDRLRGVTGRLARENAQRQPGRTASSAAALMMGVALVVFVGVFGSSIKASITDAIDQQFAGDLTILNVDGFSPFSPRIADEVAEVDGVDVVSASAAVVVAIKGTADEEFIYGLEPESATQVFTLDWEEGSDETLDGMADDEAIVETRWAKDNGVSVGDELSVTGPAGDQAQLTVIGSVNDDAGIVVSSLSPTQDAVRDLGAKDDSIVAVGYSPDADTGATREAVDALLLDRFPNAEARDQTELKADQEEQINGLLALIYVLLGFSVIVSIFGVVNTLALTILERTRELSMLRAIGTSRSQVRRMVRYESVINALLGTIVGIIVGLILASVAVKALEDEGLVLAIPFATPVTVLIAAIVIGVLAAIRPARRASKVEIVEGLQYE